MKNDINYSLTPQRGLKQSDEKPIEIKIDISDDMLRWSMFWFGHSPFSQENVIDCGMVEIKNDESYSLSIMTTPVMD